MIVMKPAILKAVILAVSATFGGYSNADQTAPELPSLFAELTHSADPELAHLAEQKIWARWLDGPTKQIARQLEQARDDMSRGDLDAAQKLLDQLVVTVPKYAEAWNQRALLNFLKQDYAHALDDIEHTLKLEPRHFGALSGRGQCYLQLNKPELALAAFEQALAIHPWLADVPRYIETLRTYLNGSGRAI